MSSLNNSVRLIGYAGADPETKTLDNGITVARVRLATNDRYKNRKGEWQHETTWHQIVLWDKLAAKAEQQIFKGAMILIEGKITSRSYVNAAGQAQYITEIRAGNYILLDKKNDQHWPEQAEESFVAEEHLPF